MSGLTKTIDISQEFLCDIYAGFALAGLLSAGPRANVVAQMTMEELARAAFDLAEHMLLERDGRALACTDGQDRSQVPVVNPKPMRKDCKP